MALLLMKPFVAAHTIAGSSTLSLFMSIKSLNLISNWAMYSLFCNNVELNRHLDVLFLTLLKLNFAFIALWSAICLWRKSIDWTAGISSGDVKI